MVLAIKNESSPNSKSRIMNESDLDLDGNLQDQYKAIQEELEQKERDLMT